MAKEKRKELYRKVSDVLNWYENIDDYPWEIDLFDKHIADEMYSVLVDVQNSYPDPEELRDEICKTLTWCDYPDEYPFGRDAFEVDKNEMLYKLLIKVLHTVFADLMEED